MADRVTLFAGPTAAGLPRALLRSKGLRLRPPVRRGDVDRLLRLGAQPGVLVICDGVFKAGPAVSHAEICRALDDGWQVWGVSSIGAIRAHEMRAEGMRGWGYVHEQFAKHQDYTDDELCLLHLPAPTFTPLTEPLVNLRYALDEQGTALGIAARARRRIVAELAALWFGDRTLEQMRDVMIGPGGVAATAADRLLAWMAHNRVKSIDLQGLLTARPWKIAPAR